MYGNRDRLQGYLRRSALNLLGEQFLDSFVGSSQDTVQCRPATQMVSKAYSREVRATVMQLEAEVRATVMQLEGECRHCVCRQQQNVEQSV